MFCSSLSLFGGCLFCCCCCCCSFFCFLFVLFLFLFGGGALYCVSSISSFWLHYTYGIFKLFFKLILILFNLMNSSCKIKAIPYKCIAFITNNYLGRLSDWNSFIGCSVYNHYRSIGRITTVLQCQHYSWLCRISC